MQEPPPSIPGDEVVSNIGADSDVLMQETDRTTQKTSVDSAPTAVLDDSDHSEGGSAELKALLACVGVSNLFANFIAEGIDMECVSDLTDEDLIKLGLSQMGLRKKFLRAAAAQTSAAVRLISPY